MNEYNLTWILDLMILDFKLYGSIEFGLDPIAFFLTYPPLDVLLASFNHHLVFPSSSAMI